MSDLKK